MGNKQVIEGIYQHHSNLSLLRANFKYALITTCSVEHLFGTFEVLLKFPSLYLVNTKLNKLSFDKHILCIFWPIWLHIYAHISGVLACIYSGPYLCKPSEEINSYLQCRCTHTTEIPSQNNFLPSRPTSWLHSTCSKITTGRQNKTAVCNAARNGSSNKNVILTK